MSKTPIADGWEELRKQWLPGEHPERDKMLKMAFMAGAQQVMHLLGTGTDHTLMLDELHAMNEELQTRYGSVN